MKIHLILLLIFNLCLNSCSHIKHESSRSISSTKNEYLYFSKKVYEGKLTTEFMRTSGLLGNLFGHFSQADYEQFTTNRTQAALKSISRDNIDLKAINHLPMIEDRFVIEKEEKRVIGNDVYSRYHIDFKVSLPFLFRSSNPINLKEYVIIDTEDLYIVVSDKKRNIAKVKMTTEQLFRLNTLNLSGSEVQKANSHSKTLSLTKKQKLDLNKDIVEYLNNENITDLDNKELQFKIQIGLENSSPVQITLEKSSESDIFLRELYLKGFLSKFNKSCDALISSLINSN